MTSLPEPTRIHYVEGVGTVLDAADCLAPVIEQIDVVIDELDVLLIALATTRPAPMPFAVEQTIMHAAVVLRHAREAM